MLVDRLNIMIPPKTHLPKMGREMFKAVWHLPTTTNASHHIYHVREHQQNSKTVYKTWCFDKSFTKDKKIIKISCLIIFLVSLLPCDQTDSLLV
jgi:hypothetical protein